MWYEASLIAAGFLLGQLWDWWDERDEFAAAIAHWFEDPTDPWSHDQENCPRCTKPPSCSSSPPLSSAPSFEPEIRITYAYIHDGVFTSHAIDGLTFHRGGFPHGADEQRSRSQGSRKARSAQ